MGCAAFSPVRFTGLNPPFVGLCKAFQINTSPFMAAVSTDCPFVNPRVGNNFGIPEYVDAQASFENPGEW